MKDEFGFSAHCGKVYTLTSELAISVLKITYPDRISIYNVVTMTLWSTVSFSTTFSSKVSSANRGITVSSRGMGKVNINFIHWTLSNLFTP